MKTVFKRKQNRMFSTVLLFCLAANLIQAQSTSYKILENDPGRHNLLVHVNPFNAQAYLADISIGYELQSTFFAGKRYQLDFDYRGAWSDAGAKGPFVPPKLKRCFQLQLGGEYNLLQHDRERNVKVTLESHSFGRYSEVTYIRVPSQVRSITAVRAGTQVFYNNYKNSVVTLLKAKTPSGEIKDFSDSTTFETMSFTGSSIGVYAGIDLKTIRDVLIDADGYGEKSNRTLNNFYLDVLFAPAVHYSYKPNANQAMYKDLDLNISENKKRLLGWRFGWQYVLNRNFGYNVKTEIGQQPGPAKGAFFMTFGFGMTIGRKVGNSSTGSNN